MTTFQDIFLVIAIVISAFVTELIYLYFSDYKKSGKLIQKKILNKLGLYVLIGSAVILCVARFNSILTKSSSYDSSVLTGIVINQTKTDQYELKTRSGIWLIQTSQELDLAKQYGMSVSVSQNSKQPRQINYKMIGKFEYGYWLWMKGYKGVLKVYSIREEGESSSWLLKLKFSANGAIIGHFGKTDHAGLLQGMLIGGKSLLSEQAYDQFKSSGLVHLIVVSGGNIMMVASFIGLLLFRLPYYVRLACVALSIVLYGSLCGRDSSVVRAVIMGIISIIGIYGGRIIDSLQVLKWTAVIMLLINPYFLVYDLGFALSFAAVLGLMLSSRAWSTYQENRKNTSLKSLSKYSKFLHKVFSDYILPGIGATLGVLPILILFSGTYNLTSFFANLLVQLIAPIATIVGALSLLFSSSSFLGQIAISASHFLLSAIFSLSEYTNLYGLWLEVRNIGTIIIIGICVLLLIILYLYSEHYFSQKEKLD